MAHIARIFNIRVGKYGEPFTICKKHFDELNRRLGEHTFAEIIGTNKERCENCEAGL